MKFIKSRPELPVINADNITHYEILLNGDHSQMKFHTIAGKMVEWYGITTEEISRIESLIAGYRAF